MAGREFDIVLYGATGFTGRLATEYVAARAGELGLRWAIAGRDPARVAKVGEASGGKPKVLVADSGDAEALEAIAARTRVMLNFAGPFALHGNAIVAGCVKARTHYADITGETAWVRALIDRHHERAARDGTRIIPCCGFDSVPSDLGTFLVARHIRRTLGKDCVEVRGYHRVSGGFNGGTIASLIRMHESGDFERMRDPFLLNPGGRHSAGEVARNRDPTGVRYDADIGSWTGPFLMGVINTRVVRRSAALLRQWGEPYGQGFRYQEYARFGRKLGLARASVVSFGMAGFGLGMSIASTRNAMKRFLPKPGEGPSVESMDRGWCECVLVGTAKGGETVRGVIRHAGDPGNRATVRFACESAFALALDGKRLPGGAKRGGILTPATGLGEVLAERLEGGGTTIEVGASRPAGGSPPGKASRAGSG
jgi:short subunit dehydrogenase-like uncharacterized protein